MPSDKQTASRKREESIRTPDDNFKAIVDCDKSKVECRCHGYGLTPLHPRIEPQQAARLKLS